MGKKVDKESLMKEKTDIEELVSHLEDEYRKANVSEKNYQELKVKYSQRLDEIGKKLGSKEEISEKKSKGGLLGKLMGKKEKQPEVEQPKAEEAGEEAKEEIARIHDLGLSGVKLHPYVECFRPDHPFFTDFFGKVHELELVVLIHTGTLFSSPGYLRPVLETYHDMKIILGHLQEGCIPLMMDFENVYSDTSGCRVKLLEYACETCQDKILFGSDFPYLSYRVQMEVVRAAEVSESVKDKIFAHNFERLLP